MRFLNLFLFLLTGGLFLLSFLYFFNFHFSIDNLIHNLLEKIQNVILTASVNLTAVIGITKTSQIFSSDTSQKIDLINPDLTQLTLTIPAGVLPPAEQIEVKVISLRTSDILFYFSVEDKLANLISVSPLYKIDLIKTTDGSSVTELSRPLTLTFFYNENEVRNKVEESEIKAYRWDGNDWGGNGWVLLPSAVDPKENRVVASTDHLSLFGIFGPHIKYLASGYLYKPSATPLSMPVPAAVKKIKADINNDGKVNLIDFSIMAYWWKRPLTFAAQLTIDLNNDERLDLIDFSILAYWWSG